MSAGAPSGNVAAAPARGHQKTVGQQKSRTQQPSIQGQSKYSDPSAWFRRICRDAELMDTTAPQVAGCYPHRPALQFAWEQVRNVMDREFRGGVGVGQRRASDQQGVLQHRRSCRPHRVQNVYMPMFVVRADLDREADFVENFAPEVAWIAGKEADGEQAAGLRQRATASVEEATRSDIEDSFLRRVGRLLVRVLLRCRICPSQDSCLRRVGRWLLRVLLRCRFSSPQDREGKAGARGAAADPLSFCIRPTSEPAFTRYFKQHVRTYRDLPVLVNQWTNVVRWERRDRIQPLLRHREFQWQEGHSAHEDRDQAVEFARDRVLRWLYKEVVFRQLMAVPTIEGEKSIMERFGGAERTFTLECFVPCSGRSMQAATAHVLGTKFSRPFDASFVTRGRCGGGVEGGAHGDGDGGNVKDDKAFVETTSWGLSTRSLAAAILVHGDDRGMVWPPRMAHTQIVILVLSPARAALEADSKLEQRLLDFAEGLQDQLEAVEDAVDGPLRVLVDADRTRGLRARMQHYEMLGVPMRVEIGVQELQKQQASCRLRHWGEADMQRREVMGVEEFVQGGARKLLERMHDEMYLAAERRLREGGRGAVEAHAGSDQVGGSTSERGGSVQQDARGEIQPRQQQSHQGSCIRVFRDAHERFRERGTDSLDVGALVRLIQREKCMVLVPWSESKESEEELAKATERVHDESRAPGGEGRQAVAEDERLSGKLKSVCLPMSLGDLERLRPGIGREMLGPGKEAACAVELDLSQPLTHLVGQGAGAGAEGLRCFITGKPATRWALFGRTY